MTIIRDEAKGDRKLDPEGSSADRPVLEGDGFAERHLGSGAEEVETMLQALGVESVDQLISEAVPDAIREREPLKLAPLPRRGLSEPETLAELARMAEANEIHRSFLGMGYSPTVVPGVIQRNVLENPSWYTQYTPYQAEISQGRLEALLNFQTMIADLTGLPVANASLLDEATAAAEAMHMCWAISKQDRPAFFVSRDCHPQTIAVVSTRAEALGIELEIGDPETFDPTPGHAAGMLLQYPTTDGRVEDYEEICQRAHDAGTLVVAACDLLALVLLRPPADFGADIAVGSSQRFGVPLGYGGPHAAFLATRERYKRQIPGRIIGVSHDQQRAPAYRMALQTREQHIRREKATSNICTAQVLLAVMAGMYAVYHGPEGLRRIARRVHGLTNALATGLEESGLDLGSRPFFDTLAVDLGEKSAEDVLERAREEKVNVRRLGEHRIGVSLDEATSVAEIETLLKVFGAREPELAALEQMAEGSRIPSRLERTSAFLTHPVFHQYHTEHEMLRYIKHLESKDLSLVHSMIPLGSCTMKLNATTEMVPISWPGFSELHPFAPREQARGFSELFSTLEAWLCEITGFAAASLQPNAGSQGEYTGLLVIRAFHRSQGEAERDICLIPVSAHGTNPASATMAGLRVVTVACDEGGNIDLADLRAKAEKHRERLAALMVTYPSTNGVFEEAIREVCQVVHDAGGQVYLDGANMNAQVGLCRPGEYGADVCHLNLHKTFCIPHGGGGPGVGPICVAAHLAPFLPSHPVVAVGGEKAIGAIAAAPWGSAGILPISWAYIALMGGEGLTRASRMAILNANYMAARLGEHYPVLFSGARGRVAHEFIVDLRPFKTTAGIEAEDVAKRLMDYGFHAPTMSFPVAGTLMIEPTESESKAELDRFCDAMISIRGEIRAIEEGKAERKDNPLKNAPHPASVLVAEDWSHPYSRQEAVYPLPRTRERKFWPAVSRIDNAWGDRNLFCTCPTPAEFAEAADGTSRAGRE